MFLDTWRHWRLDGSYVRLWQRNVQVARDGGDGIPGRVRQGDAFLAALGAAARFRLAGEEDLVGFRGGRDALRPGGDLFDRLGKFMGGREGAGVNAADEGAGGAPPLGDRLPAAQPDREH